MVKGTTKAETELRARAELKTKFDDLATTWERETINLSSAQEKVLHHAYQRIIGMGWSVIPLILERLRIRPNFWFWALWVLTGENPVSEDARGNLKAMTEAWLDWGQRHENC